MKTLKLTILYTLLCITVPAIAQDIDEFQWFGDDYEDQLFISLGVNKISLSNSEAPNSENHKQGGTTVKLDVKNTNFEKGAASSYFENKLFGDIIWYGSRVFSGKEDIYQEEESGLSSGLLGWWTFLWNVTEPKKYQIAVGANAKDFFLTAAYPEDVSKPYSNPNNNIIQEPNGNYYAVGPSIGVRYNLTNLFLIEYRNDFSIPFGKLDSKDLVDYDGKYKNPYFVNHVLEVNSSKGFFVGYELSHIINRGDLPNSTKRRELFLGFRIRI